jgi:hypothetical protein
MVKLKRPKGFSFTMHVIETEAPGGRMTHKHHGQSQYSCLITGKWRRWWRWWQVWEAWVGLGTTQPCWHWTAQYRQSHPSTRAGNIDQGRGF